MFDAFTSTSIAVDDTEIFVRHAGRGPAILAAPRLSGNARHVARDRAAPDRGLHRRLRGPARVWRERQAAVDARSRALQQTRDGARHDRRDEPPSASIDSRSRATTEADGVAYRLALDHPERVERLALFDIIPTKDAFDRADARFALGFWPWSLLAQAAPLPEALIGAAPEAVIENALGQWGSDPAAFPADVREHYVNALRSPEAVHAICEEYRAAATLDRDHDEADRRAGRIITCPVLALWSEDSSLDTWYADDGGPLGILRQWAPNVSGRAVPGGHFFPEQNPNETVAALLEFMRGGAAGPPLSSRQAAHR